MGQQFYVIRNNPAPGTPAEQAKLDRAAAKAARHGGPVAAPEVVVEPEAEKRPPVRQQPKKQSREQRKKSAGKPADTPTTSEGEQQ